MVLVKSNRDLFWSQCCYRECSIGDIVKDIGFSSHYFDTITLLFVSPDRDGLQKSRSDHGLPAGHLHPLAEPRRDRNAPPHLRPPVRLLHPRVPDIPVPGGGLHSD